MDRSLKYDHDSDCDHVQGISTRAEKGTRTIAGCTRTTANGLVCLVHGQKAVRSLAGRPQSQRRAARVRLVFESRYRRRAGGDDTGAEAPDRDCCEYVVVAVDRAEMHDQVIRGNSVTSMETLESTRYGQ